MEKHRPLVKTPRLISRGKTTPKWRKGRGFSLPELKEAGITLNLAKKLGIYVDRRRSSKHEKNVEYLKSILENLGKQES
ncbi:MAG: 50S ribosomal protein L13e [Desulfurococcales archaeon ex4484_217_1]|nr:MAG: 50S ribosomal protein L13e [Desulfurococcales archaeon ex4484_217_1]